MLQNNHKVYDAFMLYDELDILELRMNILNDHVDYFIIGEATETFRGNPKPLYYKENEKRFEKFKDKIIHCVIDTLGTHQDIYEKAIASPNTGIGHKDHWWVREFYQKECMIHSLDKCDDSDIIFVSDVDEIWNPKVCSLMNEKVVYRPIQTGYPFFLNNRSDQDYHCWVGTRFGKIKILKEHGFNHFRTEREVQSIPIPDGGWHFSWLGKTNWNKWNDGHPGNHQNFNLVNQNTMWKDESNLPEYILKNKQNLVEKNLMMP
jgi:beta-1,4-mannosyl-glycoprotein beta-1,4-N-acetylglucosaminyltransferase